MHIAVCSCKGAFQHILFHGESQLKSHLMYLTDSVAYPVNAQLLLTLIALNFYTIKEPIVESVENRVQEIRFNF